MQIKSREPYVGELTAMFRLLAEVLFRGQEDFGKKSKCFGLSLRLFEREKFAIIMITPPCVCYSWKLQLTSLVELHLSFVSWVSHGCLQVSYKCFRIIPHSVVIFYVFVTVDSAL